MNKKYIITIFIILVVAIITSLSSYLIKHDTTENINETNINGINITNKTQTREPYFNTNIDTYEYNYDMIYNRGYEHAFRDIMNATIVCKPLAITIDNTTVTLISIDCLSTKWVTNIWAQSPSVLFVIVGK